MRTHLLAAFVLTTGACVGVADAVQQPWCANLPRPGNTALERVSASSEWYQVYRVDAGVLAIAEPRQFEEVISYLVLGSDRALLFDTGLNIEPIAPLVSELTDLPVLVLNSHSHPDHVGGNSAFDVVLGPASEYGARNAVGFASRGLRRVVAPASVCGSLPSGFDPDSYEIGPWIITDTVSEGRVIDLGDRRLEVVMTPGHSPDGLMLLDRENGLLFTGDSFYEGPIYVMDTYSSFEDYAASMERVAGMAEGLRKLLTAHNEAVSDPGLLTGLKMAIRSIEAGSAVPDESQDGVTTFTFEGFSILVPDSVAEGR